MIKVLKKDRRSVDHVDNYDRFIGYLYTSRSPLKSCFYWRYFQIHLVPGNNEFQHGSIRNHEVIESDLLARDATFSERIVLRNIPPNSQALRLDLSVTEQSGLYRCLKLDFSQP